MAGSLNKVTIIGNVGKDPEIRSTQDGREVASFSVATSESWKDKTSGEKKERTEWHRVVVFSQPLINLIKSYIHKGSKLYVEGALHTRKWNDQSGAEKQTTEIVLQSYSGTIMMLDSRPNSGGSYQSASHHNDDKSPEHLPSEKAAYVAEEVDDEIPF
ncbi:MAG: single-stranded DNA-binding protein [Rickettsiales bacterium]